jgi:branched-chain amino acid transport system ATP-binding protein
MPETTTILKTENLAAGYGDHTVLSEVSFELQKGEVLVIIGQNGSGKSTLLKTVSGLLPKKAGSIHLNSRNETHIPPHEMMAKGISFFVQGGLIMPALTVQEHLELAAMQTGRKLQKTTLYNTFAEFPRLKEMQKQRAGNLSGGERQMLSFGILMMQETKTWLLDEPTAGLSPAMVQFTADFLQKKNSDGVTMLLVEHNMDVAFKLATHIAVTKDATLTRKFDQTEFLQKDFLDKIVYN